MNVHSIRIVRDSNDWTVELTEDEIVTTSVFQREEDAVDWAVTQAVRLKGVKISRIDNRHGGGLPGI